MIIKLFFPATIILVCMLRLTGYIGFRGNDDGNYCAKLRDGKLVMMHDGQIMTADVVLENGTQVKMDGSIIKQDGGTIVLKDGECVNKKGRVEDGHPRRKTQ